MKKRVMLAVDVGWLSGYCRREFSPTGHPVQSSINFQSRPVFHQLPVPLLFTSAPYAPRHDYFQFSHRVVTRELFFFSVSSCSDPAVVYPVLTLFFIQCSDTTVVLRPVDVTSHRFKKRKLLASQPLLMIQRKIDAMNRS
ncbi:hypothetical protein Ddye_019394 [Dipteronia dyeriana]|uniref:Uncharacterized protein n=1 Tax=Dipteronia dyeriana TaxID=168575 RepID=A0AAD9TXP0_9ROSI|nr:hypothetical protein Ddye_019394 [Dipteronia dyeriana]